jgi:cytochrome c peroxidase
MRYLVIISVIVGIALAACNKEAQLNNPKSVSLNLPQTAFLYYPNTLENENEKATLGRVLFYDTHLSLNNTIACASCHKQEFAFSDNNRFSKGFKNRQTSRNSPALQDFGSFTFMPPVDPGDQPPGFDPIFGQFAFFWDGRESDLKNLIMRPVKNHIEMGIANPEELPAKLAALPYYGSLFQRAFGSSEITVDKISQSVERFLSAMQATNSRFDQATINGSGLTALEEQGRFLFNTKYPCGNCHQPSTGAYFSSGFFNIGLDNSPTDKGRTAVSNLSSDEGSFKTPNLKNIAITAPYMHDGRFNTLEEVIDHYSNGIKETPNLAFNLRQKTSGSPLRLNITKEDKRALIAFLNTLTDYSFITDPKFSNPFVVK